MCQRAGVCKNSRHHQGEIGKNTINYFGLFLCF